MNKEQRQEENKLILAGIQGFFAAFLAIVVGIGSMLREENRNESQAFIIVAMLLGFVTLVSIGLLIFRYIDNYKKY
jgi:biotin transporter BioY